MRFSFLLVFLYFFIQASPDSFARRQRSKGINVQKDANDDPLIIADANNNEASEEQPPPDDPKAAEAATNKQTGAAPPLFDSVLEEPGIDIDDLRETERVSGDNISDENRNEDVETKTNEERLRKNPPRPVESSSISGPDAEDAAKSKEQAEDPETNTESGTGGAEEAAGGAEEVAGGAEEVAGGAEEVAGRTPTEEEAQSESGEELGGEPTEEGRSPEKGSGTEEVLGKVGTESETGGGTTTTTPTEEATNSTDPAGTGITTNSTSTKAAPGFLENWWPNTTDILGNFKFNTTDILGNFKDVAQDVVNVTGSVVKQEYDSLLSGDGSSISKPMLLDYMNSLLADAQNRTVTTAEEMRYVRDDIRKTFEIFSHLVNLVQSCRNIKNEVFQVDKKQVQNLIRTLTHLLSQFHHPLDLAVFFQAWLQSDGRNLLKRESFGMMETFKNMLTQEIFHCICNKQATKQDGGARALGQGSRPFDHLQFLLQMKHCAQIEADNKKTSNDIHKASFVFKSGEEDEAEAKEEEIV